MLSFARMNDVHIDGVVNQIRVQFLSALLGLKSRNGGGKEVEVKRKSSDWFIPTA